MENQILPENNLEYDLTLENLLDFVPKIISFFKYNKLVPGLILNTENKSILKDNDLPEFTIKAGLEIENNERIIDFHSFITIKNLTTTNATQLEELLDNYLSKLKNMGFLFIIVDFQTILLLNKALTSIMTKNNISLMIKAYTLNASLPITLFSIQKFNTKPQNVLQTKIRMLNTDNIESNNHTDILLIDLASLITYNTEIMRDKIYLLNYRPGNILRSDLKTFYSGNILSYTILIIDSLSEELLKTNTCKALILTNAFAMNNIEMASDYQSLINQFSISRLIIIKPSPFIRLSVEEIKNNVAPFLENYIHKEYVAKEVEILFFLDTRSEKFELFHDENYSIYDVKDKGGNYFRQINDKQNNIIAEVQINIINKKDSKATNLILLPNTKHFDQRSIRCSLNSESITNFDYQGSIFSMFFLKELEKNIKHEALVINSTTGLFPFYLNSFFKGQINIVSLETNKKVEEYGSKYLGFSNDGVIKVNGDYNSYLANNKSVQSKFNFIFYVNNYIETIDSSFPPRKFFEDKSLNNIINAMNDNSIFVLTIKVYAKESYNDILSILKAKFPKIYFIDTYDNLNRLHFCLKTNFEKDQILFLDRLKPNLNVFGETEKYGKSLFGENLGIFLERLVELQ
jgi:hypothetical protein